MAVIGYLFKHKDGRGFAGFVHGPKIGTREPRFSEEPAQWERFPNEHHAKSARDLCIERGEPCQPIVPIEV